jgi:hypothetical protein
MNRRGLSADDEARVRAALEQATADRDAAAKSGMTPPPAVPVNVAPANAVTGVTDKETLRQQIEAQHLAAEQAAIQQEQEAKAAKQAALEKQQAEMAAAKQQKLNMEATAKGAAPVVAGVPGTPATAMPAAPMTMVPGSKEQRLYDLLQLYKADRISPTEYHEQRAKIINEP